jgi:hypothetical protein
MRPLTRFATVGLVALCAATTALAASEVYKWTDDAGVVQYTDSPPDGRPFEKMKTSGSKSTATVEPVATPEQLAAAETAAPTAGTDGANCAAARQNVENISRFPEVTMDRDGDGTPEKLTAEQRQVELDRNQGLVTLYCPPDPAADGQ